MSRYRFFKRLSRCYHNSYYPLPVMSVTESLSYGFRELIQRLAFTAIGVIMLWWSWSLLLPEISAFPNVDWFTVIIAVFTLLLGIRNALSIFKGLTWGQVFLTLLFVVINAWIIWFA